MTDLCTEISDGRSFTKENGKIRNIHLPSIRYFALFISKCVLARKVASKLSAHDLAFLAAALRKDRTYNLGALIAYRLATNREKGGVCGGLIASRLLAFHGVSPHYLDVQCPIEKLDFNSMLQQHFIASETDEYSLPYNISFPKKSRWGSIRERIAPLPARALFDFDNREGWSLTEEELDAYIEDYRRAEDARREATATAVQPPDIAESSYQPSDYAYMPSFSSREPDYEHAQYDSPAWSQHPRL